MKQLKLVNGKLFETHLIAPITFKEWKESMDDGIKVVDLNSKVIFRSEDGKIQQKS